MAKCDYCGSRILFGGAREGDLRFCNAKCQQTGSLMKVSQQIPDETIRKRLWDVHLGLCPVCHGNGPVDVHTAHQVWSALVVTTWKSQPRISCRSCGVKSQVQGLLISLVAGWWGFPWGLILTPVQITRNLVGMVRGPEPMKPSPQLEKLVRLGVARGAVSREREAQSIV
jgi:DNA-directed RNA polymerase subunit RPC12/RpoP